MLVTNYHLSSSREVAGGTVPEGAESERSRPVATVQFNTRLSVEHREKLAVLLSEHPRRRATLREVIEDLIDEAYSRRHPEDQ